MRPGCGAEARGNGGLSGLWVTGGRRTSVLHGEKLLLMERGQRMSASPAPRGRGKWRAVRVELGVGREGKLRKRQSSQERKKGQKGRAKKMQGGHVGVRVG